MDAVDRRFIAQGLVVLAAIVLLGFALGLAVRVFLVVSGLGG